MILTIDPQAVAENWRRLAAVHAAPTAAVVKADGYGLGAIPIARALGQAGASTFFVALPAEGAALREAMPRAEIYILDGLLPRQAGFYLAHRLLPVLGSLAELAAWHAAARAEGRALPAALHIDTGMNRLGLDAAEADRLAAEPERLEGTTLGFTMTHLTDAERPDHPANRAQLARFDRACARLPPTPRSIANSSGIFLGPDFRSDLARPGAALYGINPTPGQPNPMRPVLRLSAPVLQLRDIEAGEAVGYNGAWVAGRPTRVATIAAGYADGYHRLLSNRAAAFFDGARLPLIGRVSMDLATFDATDQPGLVPGDLLELIGPNLPPEEVAAWAETNAYEVLTSLGGRLARVYGSL